METQYIISGQCIASVLHRLSQGFGDFEGLMFGKEDTLIQPNIGDDGNPLAKKVITIQDIFIIPSPKLLNDTETLEKGINAAPKDMKIVGWLAGKREVPVVPSLADQMTATYLNNYKQKLPRVFIETPLMLGIFCQNSKTHQETAYVDPSLTQVKHFEYKFFLNAQNSTNVKVEVQNLHTTDTKYNEIAFSYSIPEDSALQKSKEELELSINKAPQLIIEEADSIIASIQQLLPKIRTQSLQLEYAQRKNIELKSRLYYNS